MTTTLKTLVDGQQIKMNKGHFLREGCRYEVTVSSVEGYAKENNEDPAAAVARCLKNQKDGYPGHKLAWSMQACTVIESNYPGKEAMLAAKQAAYENATVLEEGEEVVIEGRHYTVKYMGDYSDPIHFLPVVQEETHAACYVVGNVLTSEIMNLKEAVSSIRQVGRATKQGQFVPVVSVLEEEIETLRRIAAEINKQADRLARLG